MNFFLIISDNINIIIKQADIVNLMCDIRFIYNLVIFLATLVYFGDFYHGPTTLFLSNDFFGDFC